MQTELNERCRLIQGSFAESKVPAKPSGWRAKLFESPLPNEWTPRMGEYVYLRPGVTVGGLNVDRAQVCCFHKGWTPDSSVVDVRVQNIRRWKSRLVNLEDVRPVKP